MPKLWAILIVPAILAAGAWAGEDAAKDPFAEAATWQPGTSRAALAAVEEQIAAARGNAGQTRKLARRLDGMLASDATTAAKRFALRQLRVIGTAEDVPAIARLLSDKDLSHMARYALQTMTAPQAARALRDALGKLTGRLRLGVINSLGEMRDAASAAALSELLAGEDEPAAEAAAAALGKIATPAAARALAAARAKAGAKRRADLTNAILLCAERLLDGGQADDAAGIYEPMLKPAEPLYVRVAGLRGIAAARKDQAAPRIVRLLHGGEEALRPYAARILEELPREAAAVAIARELPRTQEPKVKVALLTVLAERGAAGARAAVLAEMKRADRDVRLAAVRALGRVGGAGDVTALVALMGSADKDLATCAERSLVGLPGDGVNRAIVQAVGRGDAGSQERLLGVLGERKASESFDAVLALAADGPEGVRRAAIAALGQIGSDEDLVKLAKLLAAAKQDTGRAAAEKAMIAICQRSAGARRRVPALLTVGQGAPTAARAALLRVAARLGGADALRALRDAAKDSDAAVRDAALRSLMDWADDGPIDDMLRLARTSQDKTYRVLGLRAYIRMIALAPDRPAGEALAMYKQALSLAADADAKRRALSGLGNVKTLPALSAALPHMTKDSPVREAAAAAVVAIASSIAGADPQAAEAALEKAAQVSQSKRTQADAGAALDVMRKYRDFITAWAVSGPYTKGNPFSTAYAPEKDPAKARWKTLGGTDWQIDLKRFSDGNNRAAYLRVYVYAPKDVDARLELGSDDGVKVWLNGKLVHTNNANRPVKAGEDRVDVRLTTGWNTLLIKVSQNAGDWGVCAKLVGRDGKSIPGIRVSPAKVD